MMEKFKKTLSVAWTPLAFSGVFLLLGFAFQIADKKVPALIFFAIATAVSGISVFADAIRGILRGDLLDEKFLMSVAALGAFVIGEYAEAAGVMLFYRIGANFENAAVRRSRDAIRSLMQIKPDTATVKINGEWTVCDAEDVAVGSEILIKTGERVPIDSVILTGSCEADTSALTGESLPRTFTAGGLLDSGVVLLSGTVTAKTLRTQEESAASRILELVENATDNKSREETFITKFSHFYTPIVVALSILIAVIPALLGVAVTDSVRRALMFLVVSCPCALLISVPMSFFGGIGGAARLGILFKGGNVFSDMAKTKIAVFDKTGTLTEGKLSVASAIGFGIGSDEVLQYAASCEYYSNHPIAACLKSRVKNPAVPAETQECAGLGVSCLLDGKRALLGNAKWMAQNAVRDFSPAKSGEGVLYLAVDGVYRGYLTVTDTVKPEAGRALCTLKSLGVEKTVMLSGDRREVAENVGAAVGVDEVYADLSPKDKYDKLGELMAEGKTLFVGDGINDAPSLARANVGVAMGKIGQDSAIEVSDVVIMSDNLDRLAPALKCAKKTVKIAHQNIVFALAVKIGVLLLSALGVLDIFGGMWIAVFADVGVCLLDVLNAMRALKVRA